MNDEFWKLVIDLQLFGKLKFEPNFNPSVAKKSEADKLMKCNQSQVFQLIRNLVLLKTVEHGEIADFGDLAVTWGLQTPANSFIFYGKGGEIATNRIDDQETAVLSLHLLQNCLIYINTLMIQNVLSEPVWFNIMQKEDFRALTPLIYTHINPYGTFKLDMEERLLLEAGAVG